jgi:hypothetical protein
VQKTYSRINRYQHTYMHTKLSPVKIDQSEINIKIKNNNLVLQNNLLKYWKIHKSCHLSTFLALWIFIQFVSYRFWEQLRNLHRCLTVLRLLPVAVYVVLITVLRYHLFVWTVFSPKLLYEAMHTLVISLLMLLTNFLATAVVKDIKVEMISWWFHCYYPWTFLLLHVTTS